jgi:peptidoglycan/xylan/chitin deacetylase (PgdA/CDA1 family)
MAFVCLMYHDVHRGHAPPGAPHSSTMYHVDAAAFERQMAAIERSGHPVVGLCDAVSTPARPAVTLTFDDGWRGTFETALPALRRRGWTAAVFVTRDFVGRPWFCTEHMIVDAAQAGFEIGVHGTTHRLLSACPTREVVAEFADCRAYLEDLLSRPVELGSLPGGSGDCRVAVCAAEAGLRVLCTSRPGLNAERTPALALRRVAVTRRTGEDDVARYCEGRVRPEQLRWTVAQVPHRVLGEARYTRLRRLVLDHQAGERHELFAP